MIFCSKKFWIKVLIVFVAVIAVLLLIRAVLNTTTGNRLEKTLQELEARGVPLTLPELEPECPDNENAAVIWASAEALGFMKKEDTQVVGEAVKTFFEGNMEQPDITKKLRSIIDQHYQYITLIREASKKSCFKYPNDWHGEAVTMKVPNGVTMIHAIRLLGVDAVLKAEQGNVEEAIRQCLDGIRFLHINLDFSYTVNYLISIASMKQLLVCLQFIVTHHDADNPILKEALQELDPINWRESLNRVIIWERVFTLDTTLRILKGSKRFLQGLTKTRIYYWIFKPLLKSEIVWMLTFYDKWSELSKQPYYEIQESYETIQEKITNIPGCYRTAKLFIPNFITVFLKEATLEAMLTSSQIGIMCKMYRNDHGIYPESLDQLVPKHTNSLPEDPFTGNSLIYRRVEDGFIVYSLGSNRLDDHGRGTLSITGLVMEKDDDWSWQEGEDCIL